MRKPESPLRNSRRASRIASVNRLITRFIRHDAAILQPDDAPATPRQRLFMRDQKQRRLCARMQREDQIGDFGARCAIEIAGGFVGEQNLGPRRHRARQRHALLFAARQLARIVIDARAKAHRIEFCARLLERIASRQASSSGTATFSSAVIVGIR